MNTKKYLAKNRNKYGRFMAGFPSLRDAKFYKECKQCGATFKSQPHREKNGRGKFCSIECRSKGIFTPEVRLKMSLARKGKPNPNLQGEKCHFWKGGVTPKNKKIRMSLEMKKWRDTIFKRDGYKCKICSKIGGVLNADHIKPFSKFPHLAFDISNGRTLCVECHKSTDTYGGKLNRNTT